MLKSPKAIQINIAIMRTFVQMRAGFSTQVDVMARLSEIERAIEHHNEEIGALFEALHQLMTPPDQPKKGIGFTAREKRKGYGGTPKKSKIQTG